MLNLKDEQIYNAIRRGGIRLNNSPYPHALQSQSGNKRKAEINAAAAAAAAKRSRGMSTLATSSSYGSQSQGIDVMAPFEITGYNYLGMYSGALSCSSYLFSHRWTTIGNGNPTSPISAATLAGLCSTSNPTT